MEGKDQKDVDVQGHAIFSPNFPDDNDNNNGEDFKQGHSDPNRRASEESIHIEIPEYFQPTDMQKRLFQQKYKSLKAPKEKTKVNRHVKTVGRPRDKYFHLPDDLRFALNVACGFDPLTSTPPRLPKIVREDGQLFSPDGQSTSRTEKSSEGGRSSRREKEVRIVENQAADDDHHRHGLDKKYDSGANSTVKDTPKNNKEGSKNNKGTGTARNSAEKRSTILITNSRTDSAKGQANNGRVNSLIGEKTCGRWHDSLAPLVRTRPDSTSTSSSGTRSRTSRRRESQTNRGKSRESSGTVGQTGISSDSGDSDYFDSDSDVDYLAVFIPGDSNYDLSLYQRACKRLGVVTSRRTEEGLKKGDVDVSFSQLTPKELQAICIATVESTNVKRLDVAGNTLSERSLLHISEVMEENFHIKDLTLSDCQADRKGVSELIRCLHRRNILSQLDISGIGLCLEQVQLLAKYIKKSTSLQRLCISYCEIDETGANILAEALGSCASLTYLDLSWNQIRHKGALNFCMALKENDTLQELDLSWNGLGREGCKGLEAALAHNTTLKHLDVSSNRIGLQGLDCLLRGVHANTSLSSIKMGNNPLPTEGGTVVIETLLNSPDSSLIYIDLSHVAVEEEFITKLTELRKKRVIYVFHGHVMSRSKDMDGIISSRSLSSFDPILVLFEYMKQQNMRLIDLFRAIDTNADTVISKEELRAVFLSLNMGLPTGTFDAMFSKIDKDHSNTIDMNELKVIHRRVMRQARALRARVTNMEDDGFGDVLHEFQSLVRKAVSSRRTQRTGRRESTLPSPEPLGLADLLTIPRQRSHSQRRLSATRFLADPLLSPRTPGGSRRNSIFSLGAAAAFPEIH